MAEIIPEDPDNLYGTYDFDFEEEIAASEHAAGISTPSTSQQSLHRAVEIPVVLPYDQLNSALTCPICCELFTNTVATVDCMHRFCEQCITSALSVKRECPVCRTPCASRRAVRRDHTFDTLINNLYPDRELFEKHVQAQSKQKSSDLSFKAKQIDQAYQYQLDQQKLFRQDQNASIDTQQTQTEYESVIRRQGALLTVCTLPWRSSFVSFDLSWMRDLQNKTSSPSETSEFDTFDTPVAKSSNLDLSNLIQPSEFLFRPIIKTYGSSPIDKVASFIKLKLQTKNSIVLGVLIKNEPSSESVFDSDSEEEIDSASTEPPFSIIFFEDGLVEDDITPMTIRKAQAKYKSKQSNLTSADTSLQQILKANVVSSDLILVYAEISSE